MPTAVSESKPMVMDAASTSGMKAKNSSKFPQKADMDPKTSMMTGMRNNSRPAIFRTMFEMAESIAPVPLMMANMPPMIRRKKMM